MIGEVLFGRYRVDALLGAEAGGQVFRGADLHAFSPIHIKLWRPDEDPGRALLEGEVMAAVRHPGVVRLVDFGLHEGRQPCLVMESVAGRTLAERLEADGPLPWTEAFELGAQVLDALAAVHDQGLVHRDVSARTVVLLSDGVVKLVGLGHVAFASADHERVAAGEPLEGEHEHEAPAPLAGPGGRPTTDLRALGLVLWEAISGTPPAAREAEVRSSVRPDFDALPEGAPALPSSARVALDRMLRASLLYRETDARSCARRLRAAVAASTAVDGWARAAS